MLDYYGLLPEDVDAAWAMFTSSEQDEITRSSFEGFWRSVDDVRIEGVSQDGSTVTVDLVYLIDGAEDAETRRLVLEESDGTWLIADDLGTV